MGTARWTVGIALVAGLGCPGKPRPTTTETPRGAESARVAEPRDRTMVRTEGSVTVTEDCDRHAGYTLSRYVSTELGSPEVHLVGVYEPNNDHSVSHREEGTFELRIRRPGRHIIVVGSYEPTLWKISADAGVVIERVLASGHHDQRVEAPEGAAVELGGQSNQHEWAPNEAFASWARTETGRSPTSFHGCYNMSQLVLE